MEWFYLARSFFPNVVFSVRVDMVRTFVFGGLLVGREMYSLCVYGYFLGVGGGYVLTRFFPCYGDGGFFTVSRRSTFGTRFFMWARKVRQGTRLYILLEVVVASVQVSPLRDRLGTLFCVLVAR